MIDTSFPKLSFFNHPLDTTHDGVSRLLDKFKNAHSWHLFTDEQSEAWNQHCLPKDCIHALVGWLVFKPGTAGGHPYI